MKKSRQWVFRKQVVWLYFLGFLGSEVSGEYLGWGRFLRREAKCRQISQVMPREDGNKKDAVIERDWLPGSLYCWDIYLGSHCFKYSRTRCRRSVFYALKEWWEGLFRNKCQSKCQSNVNKLCLLSPLQFISIIPCCQSPHTRSWLITDNSMENPKNEPSVWES